MAFMNNEAAWLKGNSSPYAKTITGSSKPYLSSITGSSNPHLSSISGVSSPHNTGIINMTNQVGGGNQQAPTHKESWQNFWNSGDGTRDWAGGTLTKSGNRATWTGADGNPFTFSSGSNPLEIAAANPNIADQWANKWGFDWANEYAQEPSNKMSLFGRDISGLTGPISRSGSSNSSSSYSGLGASYNRQLMESLMPAMKDKVDNYDSNVDKYMDTATERARSISDHNLKEMLPKQIQRLVSKGMLNSTAGSDALKGAMDAGARDAVDKTFQAGMTGAQMKNQLLPMLGALMNNAKYSQGASEGASSSFSSDDTSPYRLMLQALGLATQ